MMFQNRSWKWIKRKKDKKTTTTRPFRRQWEWEADVEMAPGLISMCTEQTHRDTLSAGCLVQAAHIIW